ncbi:glutamate 5-kinase [Saccharophagus degradans]|uniref:Glutamate 5-kinase n=1 Tax=Saccharophagus degradans (strain 2-40 / ATCC 43961 / DSM 17024) TaxID=203122 RepID=PROB_SACD2|nr:glutamate 5-kinase [Saccharophagus degradans]Q21M06.1 RecName: Full=Glutamate 5-kinase; AltName: Full=Gamma-glutamyl kinase; Short=GK [Saccharophagus degradans 2-40]ABD80273.1 glutamate 5-kinase [Saccharophagus degradans 2-40]
MSKRQLVKQSRRWVIKIGSALLTNNGRGLDREEMAVWVKQMAALSKRGYEVVLVSSGAVAAGMTRLGWAERPKALHELQAAAAVGQSSLIQAYEQEFQKYSIKTAQILLDHDDLSNRQRYLNARSTLRTLTKLGVIPIVNENDTVVTDEIRFGDNDTLGALVANLIEADTLCILTDQKAMFDSDPRQNALAKMLIERSAFDPGLDAMAGDGGALGRGGMISKVRAARLAARSGANTIVVGGKVFDVIPRVASGEILGTLLYSESQPIAARKRWLAGNMQPRGRLTLDDGAVKVLREQGKSLLPVGVRAVEGYFTRGELVLCEDTAGREIARGLVNYSSDETNKIKGASSSRIDSLLGYKDYDELIHRDNLVLV